MILDMIQEWFKELLIDGIISNLTGMFDTLNTKVGEIAGEVGMTPAAWNSSIFSMIRNLSETVIVPIAGIILTFVMCYELIQLIIEKAYASGLITLPDGMMEAEAAPDPDDEDMEGMEDGEDEA